MSDAIAPRGFKPAQIADALQIPKSSVYRLIRDGELPAVRVSPESLIVLEEDLFAFLKARRGSPPATFHRPRPKKVHVMEATAAHRR